MSEADDLITQMDCTSFYHMSVVLAFSFNWDCLRARLFRSVELK